MSPRGLLICAGVLALVFLVSHVAGFRECTGVLCGTYSSVGLEPEVAATLGLVYAAAYVVLTILVPILLLGAGLLFGFGRLFQLMGARR
jgi:hypothetical protein